VFVHAGGNMSRRRFDSVRRTGRLMVLTVVAVAGAQLRAGAQTPQNGNGNGKDDLPTVVVLATGGTIAGAASTDVQAGYTSGQVGVDQLLNAVPQAKKLAHLKGEQISNIGSQDMNDEVWIKLATRVNELLAMPDVTGVVITHGTDTIEETAYFLNLVVKSDKPVVLTASMRPSTALSADGPLNFYNAVAIAASKGAVGRGVLVVVNDWIHGASSLTKTSTTAVQTFMSPLSGLIGTVSYGEPEWYRRPVGKNTVNSEFSVDRNTVLPRVDIIMATENMDGTLINASAAAGAKGIVIAGVGNGNMTKPALDALAAQAKRSIVGVRSSRVTTGQVGRNVEVNDDKEGLVASLGLNPQKARVLLRLALLKTSDPRTIQRYFDEY
jgi:L-asparaginase